MDTGSTFRAGSNTLRFAKYFASGTGEDNAGTEMTEVSTSEDKNILDCIAWNKELFNYDQFLNTGGIVRWIGYKQKYYYS